MGCFIRVAGLLIPVATVALMQIMLQPQSIEPRGMANLAIYGSLLGLAAISGVLLRSCSTLIVVPLEMLLAGWIGKWLVCAECSTGSYDSGTGGTVLFVFFFIVPIMAATSVGVLVGTSIAAPYATGQ